MIQFPATLLLYTFLGLMAVLVLTSFAHLYHALRFGGLNTMAAVSSGLFIAGLLAALWTSNMLLADVDWGQVWQIDLPSIELMPF